MDKARFFLCLGLMTASVHAWSSSLQELYDEAMASDPRIIGAESEAAIFQARERGSLGRLLPQAGIGAQGTRTKRDTSTVLGDFAEYYNGERYYFSASQALYDKSKWEGFRSAGKEAEQYLKRYEEMLSVVALDLVEKYTQVLAAEDNHEFVSAERKAAQEQLNLIKARYDRKLASITDLLAVEARTDVLISQELDAQNTVYIAREMLSEVLGRDVNEPLAPLKTGVTPAVQVGLLEDWINKGLAENDGLVSQRLAVKAASTRVKEATGQRHPTVGLTVSAQKSDIGYENAQTPPSDTYVAAVNFNLPLYSGGQVSAMVSEAQARLRLAEQEYQQSERALRRGVREAYLNTSSAQERVAATRKALESAEKSYEAQQKGFKYGTVTVVDVLDASQTLYEARRDHRKAFYDLMLESLTLDQVAGQFTPNKISDLNSWLEDSGATEQ